MTQNHNTTSVTFFSLQNVLFPEGRCVAYSVGLQLFLLMFNIWVRKRICHFKNHATTLTIFSHENVIQEGMGWMDGWDGRSTFVFLLISRKLLEIFSKFFLIHLYNVLRYLQKKIQKFQKILNFSELFLKNGVWFFFDFFSTNLQISRKQLIIFC